MAAPFPNGCLACGAIIPAEAFYCSRDCIEWDYRENLPVRTITREDWLSTVDEN